MSQESEPAFHLTQHTTARIRSTLTRISRHHEAGGLVVPIPVDRLRQLNPYEVAFATGEAHLLLISTGNSSNAELEKRMRNNLSAIEAALNENRFVEINRDTLVIHE